MTRVLVTGAAGFIGAHLVRRLAQEGAEITALDDFSVGPREALAGVEVFEADLRDAEAVRSAVDRARPDVAVHLAALHFIPYCAAHPRETMEVNVVGTQNLVDAFPGGRVVFASTGDAYRPAERRHREDDDLDPINVYGASKIAGEWLLRLRPGGETIVLRLFNTYGPGETNPHVLPDIFEQLKQADVLRLGNTEAVRDYVFVEDVVETIADAAQGRIGTGVFNVGTGAGRTVADLTDRIAALTGRELRVETDPARVRTVERWHLVADVSALDAAMPLRTRTAIDDGLARTLAAEGLL